MPRIGNSIGLGSGFPGPRWRRLLGMTSDWTGHRLLPWRCVFTLSAAIVTSYNMDGLPHGLVIYRELQANCKCLPMSIPCPSAQLYPFKCWYCPFFMPGIGHTCRDPGIRAFISQHLRSRHSDLHSRWAAPWHVLVEWVIGEAGVESEEVEGKASISPSRTQVPINPGLEVAIS